MKKFTLFILFIFIASGLKPQAPFPTAEEIAQFMKSKTCVVLEDDPFSAWNSFIKEAVNSSWTITPFEFINITEFNKRRTNPEYSFIVLTQTHFEKDKTGGLFNFINLIQGKRVSDLSDNPEICAVPLSFASDDDMEYGYKLGLILAFIQKHARLISEDPSLTGRRYLRYYNVNAPQVIKKTIMAKKEDLAPDINTINAIKAIYPFPFKIVDEEEIIKAINEKTPGTLILHKVGPKKEIEGGLCFKMLFGTDDSNMYYFNQHRISKNNPNAFLEADLRRLARYK
ncbi:MAG TPA: hypothetical protein PLN06_08315 [Bacteroidales bacterium]|nr:hypothetical protein [Bacteroidales bacterium]HQJ21238.1 hypothetical protein [Bacteroidales bacterium]